MKLDPKVLENLALHDPLAYGFTYLLLQHRRPWEHRPWLIDPYNSVNPYLIEKSPVGIARRMVVIKSTQCGLSTLALVRMFHFADYWPISSIYMLPRQPDVIDFVSTRVDDMVANSPRLTTLLTKPDSTHAKKLGNSYLFFTEATVEPRMIPADVVFADEVDLCDPTHLATARNRMDASGWKLEFFFSTPTVTNYGIHGIYLNSDQNRWCFKCPECSTWQTMEWNKNLRVIGAANNPDRVYYGCERCDREITPELISSGQWIPEKPVRSHALVGYHISQMMYYPAPVLYDIFRDPQTTMLEFYRKRLGMPYELGAGSLEREDILVSCFDEPYDPEDGWDKKSHYYMGIDQGNELQILIAKIEENTKRPKIVHIELVPFDVGFRRVTQLMRIYHIRRAIGDANPNRHNMNDLCRQFPGKFLLADYSENIKARYQVTYTHRSSNYRIPSGIILHRTQGFDHVFERVRSGYWHFPGEPPRLQPTVELLIDHITALRRDVEPRKTSAGEVLFGVYRAIRADHLAHAMNYLQAAIDIDQERAGTVRVAEATPPAYQEPEQLPGEDIPKEIRDRLLSWLGEVPKDQLQELLSYENRYPEIKQETLPFPLSYKYQCCLNDGFTPEQILAVVPYVLKRMYG